MDVKFESRRKPTKEQLVITKGLGGQAEKFPLAALGYDPSTLHALPYDIGNDSGRILGAAILDTNKSTRFKKFYGDLQPQLKAGEKEMVLLALSGLTDSKYPLDTVAHETRHVGFNKLREAGYELPSPLGFDEEALVRLLGVATGTENPATAEFHFNDDPERLLKKKEILYGLMQLQQAAEQVRGIPGLTHYPKDMEPLRRMVKK